MYPMWTVAKVPIFGADWPGGSNPWWSLMGAGLGFMV